MQTILAIDDDPAQVKVIEMSLREANYDPITATNGEEGLKAFRLHQPDLVILDVMMPGMDGWETCYRIRQISPVPIISLTCR
jgi:DNA-binding response OmpR family regulator